MDLSLTDDQQAIAQLVREMCTTHFDRDRIRSLEDRPGVFPESLWKHFTSSGLAGITIPSRYGGEGAGLTDLAVVAEELGRAAAPLTPLISSVLCGGLLSRLGDDEQRAEWLPQLAAGTALATMAWLEPTGGYHPDEITVSAEATGAEIRLRGDKHFVPHAEDAAVFLVPARDSETGAVELYLVAAGPGVEARAHRTMSGELLYTVTFDATIPARGRLGEPGAGWSALDEAMLDLAAALACYAAGGARRALEMATEYAKTREQFGQPLGAFQAIAHRLADDLVAVEGAETLAREAAWARDQDGDSRLLATMAKQHCGRVFRDVAASAHQIFGGMGFTVDMDIQLYSRRAKQLQLLWWDNRYLEARMAELVLDGAEPGVPPPFIER
ncbi:acyl-CoA dehydrogenase family protein [Enemella sp. A6]|uniref:acyl-CoA dehydrogenase family protein n=1 Tax=Enemella sp. A6 TaxID=3440152 RepID=UPI003EB73D13